MDDLISRQELLKLPRRKGYAVNGWEEYIRVDDIKKLLSVQSELSNNSPKLDKEIGECNDCIKNGGDWECDRVHCHKGDVISRQAAIERATKDHDFFRGATIPTDKARRDELLNVMCWLGELPSVQPEIIRCKDCRNCKHWEICPCGKTGHERGTSIGYSIGECKDYEID